MNQYRDSLLQHMGIGPTWKLRQQDDAVHMDSEPEKNSTLQTSQDMQVQRKIFFVAAHTHQQTNNQLIFDERGTVLFGNLIRSIGLSSIEDIEITSVPVLNQPISDENSAITYRRQLQEKITIAQPKVILIFGVDAANALLETETCISIEKLRGDSHSFQNIPIVVTHSIENLLSTPINKAETWIDLCKATALL
jgi:uracil-DNA glycosylase family 4